MQVIDNPGYNQPPVSTIYTDCTYAKPDSGAGWYRQNFSRCAYDYDPEGELDEGECRYFLDDSSKSAQTSSVRDCNTSIGINIGSSAYCSSEGLDACALYVNSKDEGGKTSDYGVVSYNIDYTPPCIWNYDEVIGIEQGDCSGPVSPDENYGLNLEVAENVLKTYYAYVSDNVELNECWFNVEKAEGSGTYYYIPMDLYEEECYVGRKINFWSYNPYNPDDYGVACINYNFTDITGIEDRKVCVHCADHWNTNTNDYLNRWPDPPGTNCRIVRVNGVGGCTVGATTDCITPQGCPSTITCVLDPETGDGEWEPCPDAPYECSIGEHGECGACGTTICDDFCSWGSCGDEGECQDNSDCTCPPGPTDCVGGQRLYYEPTCNSDSCSCSCEEAYDNGLCNPLPVCESFTGVPDLVLVGDSVSFIGVGSDDEEINRYKIDFEGNGNWIEFSDFSPGETVFIGKTHQYNTAGIYYAKIIFRDNNGAWSPIPGDCEGEVCPDCTQKIIVHQSPSTIDHGNNDATDCDAKNSPAITLYWTFEDPDEGSDQTARQVKIFDEFGVLLDGYPTEKFFTNATSYAPVLAFDSNYSWQVNVWDDNDVESGWLPEDPVSFTTSPHYPFTDFYLTPRVATVDGVIQFCSVFESGICNAELETRVVNDPDYSVWQWNFGDGDFSTEQNPTHSYLEVDEYDIYLSITETIEGIDYSCVASTSVNVRYPLPEWIETPPIFK